MVIGSSFSTIYFFELFCLFLVHQNWHSLTNRPHAFGRIFWWLVDNNLFVASLVGRPATPASLPPRTVRPEQAAAARELLPQPERW